MRSSESIEQQALISWWQIQYPHLHLLLFHIPNGGLRNIKTAARLKKEGVKAGVADLFLAIPASGLHGLFIEMKRKDGGKQTELQKSFEEAIKKQCYGYTVCHGWEAAANVIKTYLNQDLKF